MTQALADNQAPGFRENPTHRVDIHATNARYWTVAEAMPLAGRVTFWLDRLPGATVVLD